ncbi:endonuclease V [Caudoviricetes sp.]|nr:endonuclease V [Caudoviricetes sp.]
MTRINAGVPPATLCDQHLIAEYRELPRMVAFAHTCTLEVAMAHPTFTLGTGHMKSVVRFGAYLSFRHKWIVAEMRCRQFEPTMPAVTTEQFPAWAREFPSDEWLAAARIIVEQRIRDRIATMKKPARWFVPL